jgi:hypothetical protein
MLRKLLRSKKGGVGSIIALLITIILVLGLISYSVLGQVEGVKDTGDKASIEQQKINLMLQDPNVVTGNTIKSYIGQAGTSLTVRIKNSSDIDFVVYNTVPANPNINDGGLYNMLKNYNSNGTLSQVSFTQIDLSR